MESFVVGSEPMSRTYRKSKTNSIKEKNTVRRFKKNKFSWTVFREEKSHIRTLKDVAQHVAKVSV